MKAIILAAALAVSATLSMAQETITANENKNHMKTQDLEVALLKNTSDQVTLYLAKEPGTPVKIKVYEDNKLLYTRRVKKAGTANFTYDISQFPDGEYTFKIEKDKDVVYTAKVQKGATALADSK